MVDDATGDGKRRSTPRERPGSRSRPHRDDASADWELSTPVVLPIHDRPEETARVAEAVAAVEPPTLYVVADGPEAGDPDAAERCRAARQAVERAIDWNPEVHRRYRERNHGVESVAEGLDWVFEREPEAIVVEDDCVPNRDFFRFCEAMLERYRDDDRVMAVNGTNRLGTWGGRGDYHFVTYQGVWGWATWREAWERYDPEMSGWPDPEVQGRIREAIGDDERFAYQRERFQRRYDGESVAWSKPWQYTMYLHGGLAVVPPKNLVSNVGFGEGAIHTTDPDSPLADLARYGLEFPLEEPPSIEPDRAYERECFERFRRTGRLEAAAERLERFGKEAAVSYLPEPALDRLKRLR